ncbi:hypothetical protein DEE93_17710 [Ralstonia pickettii]|uniref:Uncharacterized protein n=1 Tax=Ralstonia pickettii TaxID=329 RepID=A0AAW4QAN9_RALPI|nr:hypothetical protein [Ralstonia pickettii]MBA9852055.1 hypothetical protein [Ralstonia pickettii]MBA9919930.1 hypothetical protein [Ralstonia pickettii]MBA9959032.1 hypothetical protein [Ralstonia pickettii]MBA9964589.1 hypothetical protein [Ralstonia pickettii]
MLVSSRRHQLDTERLTSQVQRRDEVIAGLEARIEVLERTRHDFVEEMRYVLESGACVLAREDEARRDALKTVGHVLPYLLSGKRHWSEPAHLEAAASARSEAQKLAEVHGFVLPTDPEEAVKAMLALAMMLFTPEQSLPVEGLRVLYPAKA